MAKAKLEVNKKSILMAETKSKRLLSLDVLRGMTVAGMILVNNGGGRYSFEPLNHSAWNGLTPCDLVFPFFLFMVGVSIFISLSRHAGEPGIVTKIIKRTVIMFAIGVLLHAWDMLIWGDAANIPGYLRIWGVLQRIALSYCGASLLFLAFQGRHLWKITFSLLAIYAVILLVGNGYSEVADENWLGKVDRVLFGNHIYSKVLDGRTPVDPEGLVGVISGIAHAMIGVICGKAIMKGKDVGEKIMNVVVIGAALGIAGYLISYGLPINKRIWSPSYVLVTCGMGACLLGLFTWLIDLKGYTKWSTVFQWFGMNALFVYIVSEMFPSVFGVTGISGLLFDGWASIFGPGSPWSFLFYALTLVAMMAFLAWLLFRKKIIIKI